MTHKRKPSKVTGQAELAIIPDAFDLFFPKCRGGFVGIYVPQFSTTDSQPKPLEHHIENVQPHQLNLLRDTVRAGELAGSVASHIQRKNDDLHTLQINLLIDPDIVIGRLLFFSLEEIDGTAIESFASYCQDVIALRKKADAVKHLAALNRSLPHAGNEEFFRVVAEQTSLALKCADVLILGRDQHDIRRFNTIASVSGLDIQVPEGPSVAEYCISEEHVLVDNDVAATHGKAYRIHNRRFCEVKGYKSFLAKAILRDYPADTFIITCFFMRRMAISKVEIDLFETLCLVIEGMCLRDRGASSAQLSNKYADLVRHALLVADVMHDATEDLVIARNNLSCATTNTSSGAVRIESAKNILEDVISSARAFKEGLAGRHVEQRRRLAKTSISDLIETVISKYRDSPQNAGVTFTNLASLGIEHRVFARYLKCAVDNALKNSLKHLRHASHRKKEVRVRCYSTAHYLVIEVADNGLGIPEEVQDKILNPGFSTTAGLGLGMTIIEGAALVHNGRLVVESRPGYGCTVKIMLGLDA